MDDWTTSPTPTKPCDTDQAMRDAIAAWVADLREGWEDA